MRDFLIDTDTASDDAVAILMALAAPDVRVLGLTTVAGNVSVEQATRNALLTVEIAGADVPVFMGPQRRSSAPTRTRTGSTGRTDSATAALTQRRGKPRESTRSTPSCGSPTPIPGLRW